MLRLKIILQYNVIYIALLIIAIISAYIRFNCDVESIYDLNEKEFKGELLNYKVDGDKFTFIIKGKEKLKCTYYIKSEDEKKYLSNLDTGITLLLTGNLNIPLNNTIPNTFNYKKYLKQNKINYTLSVDKFEIENFKTNIFYTIKNKITRHINNYKSKNYLLAFIIGDKGGLDETLKDEFQNLGISHIFAISGMHISLLSSMLLLILKKFRIKEELSYIIVIIFLCFYIFLTNIQASIVRSIGLFILLYMNRKLDFNIETINILLVDISIILIIFPNFLYNIGFLYSSVVSYSLIKYSHFIKGNFISKTVIVSLIAFAFSLPITIFNNFEFNLLSIINNLVIVPFVSFILYPLSVLSFFIPVLDNILLFFTDILESLIHYLLTFNIIIPKVNAIFIIIYYVLLYFFMLSYKKIFLILIILIFIIVKVIPVIDQNYYIYFLDVGQGDSIVIKKGSECILIDTGGAVDFKKESWKERKKYNISDNTVKFLHSIGVSKIDYCILTHGDSDHAKEINNILTKMKVKNIILNKGELNYLEKAIPQNLVTQSYNGKMNFSLLDIGYVYDNENDNSVITLLNAYNYKILFMGDASMTAEKDFLKKYNIQIDLIKLGHHGSKTSSNEKFLEKIKVKNAIISSGRNNRYNHPNKETIETLKKLNINYLNTQDKGTILYKISKNNVTVFNFLP